MTFVSSGNASSANLQVADAGRADFDVDPARRDARRGRELDGLGGEDRVAVVDLELRERRPAVANADLRADRRAREPDARELHVLELEVVRHRLCADADGMDRHAEARDLGDLRGVEVGRIVGAVGDEHDGRDRSRLGAAQHVQQRLADVGDGARRRHLLERRQLDEVAGEREKIDGELALERRQRALGEAVDGLLQPRRVLVAVEHAARRVEQHGHGVLLRPQRLRHERGAPQQHEHGGDERRLQCAEHRCTNDA